MGSSARAVAASVERGVVAGVLAPGERLPTVRSLARALGVSPATVSAAYRALALRGLTVAAGRRGTRIAPRPPVAPSAPVALSGTATDGLRDLTSGFADPELMPALRPALVEVAREPPDAAYQPDSIHPRLLAYAGAWFEADGVPAGPIVAVSGGLDGVERALAAHLRTGDRVLIEDPAYPPIRDILLGLGLVAVPVAVDERGLLPAALAAELRRRPAALVLVPRAQNPTGATLDGARAAELAAALAGAPDLLVVEDDHVSLVAGAPYHSVIAPPRERWALVRSFSKLLHPDLRLAVLTGDRTTLARVEGRQALGPRYVSHLLQATAAKMLTDPGFPECCTRARRTYATRRRELLDALAQRGLAATGASGLNVWIPVREESR